MTTRKRRAAPASHLSNDGVHARFEFADVLERLHVKREEKLAIRAGNRAIDHVTRPETVSGP